MIAGILLGILAGMLANELCEFSPWCARKLVRWSAFRQYTDRSRAEMRAEEWTAVINVRPGNLFKLITAAGFTAAAIIVSGRRAIGRESDVGPGSKVVRLVLPRIDTKTGLLNVSTWEREAEVEINRAVRTGSPLALALVDIDHLKAVNDTYGRLVGDKAIRAVTDALCSQLRAYDLAGRFGGEEFAILLPQARELDAINVAERFRAHIAAMSIPAGDDAESGPCVKLTISVGVTVLDGASRELTDMLAAADLALYHAKETGCNKTHVITALPDAPVIVSGRAGGQGSNVGVGSKAVRLVRRFMPGRRLARSRIGQRLARSRIGQRLARSRLDTKTGLLNTSTWEQEAAIEINRAVRTGSPLALALVDIDHFKAVNDTYGRLVGDKVLRAVTNALRSQLRASGLSPRRYLAGRFGGGEEFAILLPQAREVDAINVAERFRAHIAAMSIPAGDDAESGPCVKLTISVGVTVLDGASRELTDMLAAADLALYHAKETGCNKTHVITAIPA